MAGSKHFISVHYHQTNHINLQEAAVAILSEPEGVQIHVLMAIKLSVLTAAAAMRARAAVRASQGADLEETAAPTSWERL